MVNAAYKGYDLNTFQQPTPKAAPKPQIKKLQTAKVAAPKVNTLKVLLVVALIVISTCFYLYGRVKLNELNTQYADMVTQIEILNNEKVRLDMELNEKMSLKNVEDYAVNTLGLTKLNAGQVQYISLENPQTQVEQAPQNKSLFAQAADFISTLWYKVQL